MLHTCVYICAGALTYVGACLLHLKFWDKVSHWALPFQLAWLASKPQTSACPWPPLQPLQAFTVILCECWDLVTNWDISPASIVLTLSLIDKNLQAEGLLPKAYSLFTCNQSLMHIFLTFKILGFLSWGTGHFLNFTVSWLHDMNRHKDSESQGWL